MKKNIATDVLYLKLRLNKLIARYEYATECYEVSHMMYTQSLNGEPNQFTKEDVLRLMKACSEDLHEKSRIYNEMRSLENHINHVLNTTRR